MKGIVILTETHDCRCFSKVTPEPAEETDESKLFFVPSEPAHATAGTCSSTAHVFLAGHGWTSRTAASGGMDSMVKTTSLRPADSMKLMPL